MRPRQREHRMHALTLPSRSRGDEPQRRRGVVRDFRHHTTATLDLGRLLPGVGRGGHPSCADDDPCSSEPLPASASSRHDTSPFRAEAAHWGGTTPVDEKTPTDTGTGTRSEQERDAMSTVPECQDGLRLRWWSSMTSVSCHSVFGLSANRGVPNAMEGCGLSGCVQTERGERARPYPGTRCEVGIRPFREDSWCRGWESNPRRPEVPGIAGPREKASEQRTWPTRCLFPCPRRMDTRMATCF